MNAITSCRRLFADLADKLKPATTPEDNNKYKNRLYAIIQEATKSKTKGVMLKNLVDELKKRIDLTCNMTQGAAHTEKTTLQYAQDTVLYTYLIVAEVAEAYAETHSVSADIVKT